MSPQLGLIGQLTQFDDNAEDFQLYIERLEQYFAANDIDATKKVAVFISVLGCKTYKLLRNLLQPKIPKDCTYDELVKALSSHFQPAPIIIAERFRFHKRNQNQNESVSTYLVELRRLASTCDFGAFLEEAVRDRFVCGLRCEATQKRLLAKRTLKLSEATEIALAMELAEHDAANIKVPTEQDQGNVHKIKKSRPKNGKFVTHKTFKCYRCGASHSSDNCKYKSAKCHKCGKTGHIAPVCKSKEKSARKISADAESNDDTNDLQLFKVKSVNKVDTKVFTVPVKICNKEIIMELDTAADITLISQTWQENNIPFVKLKPTSIILRDYNGQQIETLGKAMVPVVYEQQCKTLSLIVVKGNRPALFGRDWISAFQLNWKKIFSVQSESNVDEVKIISNIKKDFTGLFRQTFEPIKHFKAILKMKDGCTPVFCKARPVPYAIKQKVSDEIMKTKERGVWNFVEHSNWATPLVVVPKKDGSVRLCGDFKITTNKHLDPNQYPLPTQQDLFSTLSGGKYFSKLDLSHAYQQVELATDSQEYLTLNTHLGLLRPTRLLYGITCAASVFQSIMEQIIQGLPSVICFQDDILVSGSTFKEHVENLKNVFARLQKYNVKLNESKCEFAKKSVVFLGHLIDAQGIHPTDDKIKAIISIDTPTNVTELKSFLGLLNYYAKFIKNASMILAPLYDLLRADAPWDWTETHEQTFQQCKQLLTSDVVLVHYNENFPLRLSCDASSLGLGVILSHIINNEERPIAYASRTLTNAEKNYSQLEKEASAIMFGIKKFHQYLYGRKFTIVTDHQPLITIFGAEKSVPALAAARLQRWAILLSTFQYSIQYKKGIEHSNADALSRIPLVNEEPEKTEIFKISYSEDLPINSSDIARATCTDALLGTVLKYIQYGWPNHIQDEGLKPYFLRKHELSVDCQYLLWGMRVIVPEKYRKRLLGLLHDSHPGIVRMKSIARSHIWWPLIDSEIENLAKQCSACQENSRVSPATPLQPWTWPKMPWDRIHVDFAQKDKRNYFIIVDSHSKWIEVIEMSSITSEKTIEILQCIFAKYGLPSHLVSDNGPTFTSYDFRGFLKSNGVKHTLIPPYHPKSNGLAERSVQTFKQSLKKMNSDENDHSSLNEKIFRFLMKYRSTPHTTTQVSPAELFLGRPIRTLLSLIHPSLSDSVRNKQCKQKKYHDHIHIRDQNFKCNQLVWIYSYRKQKWMRGQLIRPCGNNTWRANVNHTDQLVHLDQLRPLVDDESETDPDSAVKNKNKKPLYYYLEDDNMDTSTADVNMPSTSGNASMIPQNVNMPVSPVVCTAPDKKNDNLPRRNPVRDRKKPTKLNL